MKKWIIVLTSSILTFCISISGYTQNSKSTKGYGKITGTVKVFEKNLLRDFKEKDDLSGVIVYLTGLETKPPKEVPNLVQQNKAFNPTLLPIVAGQTVSFPNHDGIYHNVFSVSPVKSFDLGQYKSTDPPKDITFDKAGLVPVFCNIHPQMISFVLVLENNAFGESDKEGKFVIPNVPPGSYTINAWKPKTQRMSSEVEVLPGQETVINFELKEVEKIPPHKRKDGSNYPGYQDDWES
ncbi:MAG TPA: carboxypeptidase regulatory-like domain-containing protein [Thermodesulfobacteriota bacterium]|nr:carboxypeptidase regulatory-like domain-containing protein [Thermodesulfobacteriota bacterium]